MSVLSIIIPAYNEAGTINLILDRIRMAELVGDVEKEIVLVNDCSTDDTEKIVKEYMQHFPAFTIKYFFHETNKGKGAAIHTGIKEATGDYIIIQDADLEYDPEEYNLLLKPMLNGNAEVVYGSRFAGGKPHRILFFWHTIGNRFLTLLSNLFSNLNLSDMETCYKLFKSDIIKNISLVEKRFGFEPEVTQKLARIKGARMYEVGISYYGRTYQEGKKINWKDGFRAIYCIFKYGLEPRSKSFKKVKLTKAPVVSRKNSWILLMVMAAIFFSTGLHNADKHYREPGFKYVFISDGLGYYQYLPAQFISHSLATGQRWYVELENGKMLNIFSWGVAYMQVPFFFMANIWCQLTGQPTDGYSAVNGFFIVLGAMIYCFLALLLIFKMLLPRFGFYVSLISVLLIFYATNLIYYTLAEAAMSHVYTFFLIALFIYKTPFFYKKPGIASALWLAFPLAVMVLIRQTNLMVVIYLFLYDVKSLQELNTRGKFWMKKVHFALLILAIIFLAFIPQLVYWHLITGEWYIFAYVYKSKTAVSFIYWNSPKVGAVLAGPVSGWLVYTPIMILSVVGMVVMLRKKILDTFGIVLIFLITLYIISSWWSYSFDCGFGHRGFIDYYALFAIPLAFVLNMLFNFRKKILNFFLAGLFVFLMYLNVRLSMMYNWDSCWNGPGWTWKHYSNVIQKAAKGGDYKQNYHVLK